MRYGLFITLILAGILLILGCSGGSELVSPLQTKSSGMPILDANSRIPVGVSDWLPDGSPAGGEGLMGLFNLHLDPLSIEAELTPLRKSGIADVLEVVDITGFLQVAPCTKCVKLKSVSLTSDGDLSVEIGIRHPFPAGDPFKPITGRNRADLHVFNVEGIVLSNAAITSFPGIGETIAGFKILNADGYTGYLDESLDEIYPTEASVHPYRLHFDDYTAGNFDPSNPHGFDSVTDPPPTGNLVMAMGCDFNFQDYIFSLDSGPIDIMYAVGCTYALSAAVKSQRFNPEYRVPQHLKKAASEISVQFVSNDLRSGDTNSSAEINIDVVDVNYGVPVGDNLNEMRAESNVDDIFVEVPGVLTSPVVVDGNSPVSGTGHSPSDPLVYSATIKNSAGGVMGTYTGIIKVTDTYPPGQNVAPLLLGKDGIKRVGPGADPLLGLYDISEFAAYQVFSVDVGSGCGPITGSILSPNCPITNASNEAKINFTVQASSANGGGNIVLYEVDYDYDGANFTMDASNTDGIFNNVGPFKVADPCPSNIPHDFTVAFRGTDECVPPNHTIFATCTVTVNSCLQAVGNVTLKVNYVPSDIYPPDTTPQGWKFDPAGPFTLSWASVSGVAEYAIYYDNNPDDGLKTAPLILVGTVLQSVSPTYTVPGSLIPANRYIKGFTFYVCSRATVGGANSAESEPAYVTTSSFETGPQYSLDCEGWISNCEANTTDFRYRPYAEYFGGIIHIQGPYFVFFTSQFFGPGNNNRWHGWAKKTQVVPDSTVRYLSFSAYSYYIFPNKGMFVGTINRPDCPTYNWTTPSEMQWSAVDSTGLCHGYDYNSPQVASTFTDVPNTNNAWCTPGDYSWHKYFYGGDMNIGGATSNASDPCVAIEFVYLDSTPGAPQTCIDEAAIAIY